MIDISAVFSNYSGSFPNFLAVNVSAPGSGDGTEFIAALVNNEWGQQQALMSRAGLTPNGVTEAAGTAQIIDAISKGFACGAGFGVIYWKNDTPAAHGDRVLLLQGQVISIASYSDLVSKVYCGDANNGTAPAFYKTSDAGGTTRSTSGAYFVLPDCRGLSLKMIGNATVNGRTKTGPTSLGEMQEDQMQKITGGPISVITQAGGAPPSIGALRVSYAASQAGSGTSYNQMGLSLDSSQSPNARASLTTDGATRDSSMGTNYGIAY